jgi:uncharacterized protein
MKYSFVAYGHENVLANHLTTLEVTKESHLSKRGDCIIGVRADFDKEVLQKFLLAARARIEIRLAGTNHVLEAWGTPNTKFCSDEEFVIRRGEFLSERTALTRSTIACSDIPRSWLPLLRNPEQKLHITVEPHEETIE